MSSERKQLLAKLNEMTTDMQTMKNKEFKSKYGNPSQVWAKLQWEKHKLNKRKRELGLWSTLQQ